MSNLRAPTTAELASLESQERAELKRLLDKYGWPWETMESARRDGTHILIYCPVEKRIVSSWWCAQPGTENGGGWYGTDPMDRLNWIQYPTHWCSLPPAPSINEKD